MIRNRKLLEVESKKSEMIKDIKWNINYHVEKLRDYKLQLKVLQDGK